MDEVSQTVQCGGCGAPLIITGLPTDERKACHACGSAARHFNVNITDTLHFHASLSMKNRNKTGKILVESANGDDLHRNTGKWMHKERVLDHVADHYKEVVIDPKSGEVIHYQEEPLSRHRGHGR